jgi:amino acid adenylation domain-containing protein
MTAYTVVHQIADSCRRYPGHLAIFTPHGFCDYAELESIAHGLQLALYAGGLPDNRLVGVLSGDHPLCYASILAILASGCAYVPINSHNPLDRNKTILNDADVNCVLAHYAHEPLERAVSERAGCTLLRSDTTAPVPGHFDLPQIDSDTLAYLFYTSGSTGAPKGVPIYHRNLNAYMKVMLDPGQYSFTPEDRFLQMFDLTFDLSIASFITPLCIGASVYVIAEDGMASVNVLQMLQRHEITVALMVPSVLFYVQRHFDEIRFHSMRYSLFCGEALPHSLAEKWARCVPNAHLQNLYGPTEATIACLRYDWEQKTSALEAENGVVAIGKPFPDVTAFVVDEAGHMAPAGQRGELCLAGPQVTDRYWRNAERTAAAFFLPEGFASAVYRTGDVCFINDRGNFVFCGRLDHQIKIDGYRVELGEIEHFAREAASGINAIVVVTNEPCGASALTLFLEGPPVDCDAVMAYLARKLPTHILPKRIEVLEALPLNINGKVDRPALAARVNRA